MRAVELYGAIVTQARRPAFFAGQRVEDTPEGRTGLLILLLFPVLERLQQGSERDRRTARNLVETFVTDIDDCLREMGVGDLSVPRKVKRAAQALGERCLAYRRAVASPEPIPALASELAATVPGLAANEPAARAIAQSILDRISAYDALPAGALAAEHMAYPGLAEADAEPTSGVR